MGFIEDYNFLQGRFPHLKGAFHPILDKNNHEKYELVSFYTRDGYKLLNTGLRVNSQDEYVLAFERALNSALDFFQTEYSYNKEKYKTLYRKAYFDPEIIKDYKKDQEITFNQFISTSASLKGTESFIPGRNTLCVFENCQNGINISAISEYHHAELEIIFKSRSSFKILSTEQRDLEYILTLGDI